MFQIEVYKSNGSLMSETRCVNPRCKIGSSRDCLVRLRGWSIAPVHAELKRTAKGLFVVDRAGKKDLRVNGKVVPEYGPISPEDSLSINKYVFKVAAVKPERGEQDVPVEVDEGDYMSWVRKTHHALVSEMDQRRVNIADMNDAQLRSRAGQLLDDVIAGLSDSMPEIIDTEQLHTDVVNEAVGLGPLEGLLADPDVTEIMVNRYDDIYIERGGKLFKSDISFSNDGAVRAAIERIVSPIGRRIDESSPMVDARLLDGSRVNAVIPPLALKGPCITIRKFSDKKLEDQDLLRFGAATDQIMKFLAFAVKNRRNIVISGGTGSGKTTLLNILSNYIPAEERVVTVEDAAELKLAQPHVVSLEARPANIEGKGQVTIRDLVKNCLRMRPDRIVVGECRGGEALDMLQAMNTGHDGSLTTAHANSPQDLLSRLEVMVLMAGMELPISAIREQINSAVDLVVQQSRFHDGSRKISAVCELVGLADGKIQLREIYRYRQTGSSARGVEGQFEATGYVPAFCTELRSQGVAVDDALFG